MLQLGEDRRRLRFVVVFVQHAGTVRWVGRVRALRLKGALPWQRPLDLIAVRLVAEAK